ncbi:hypothetical protein G3554_11750 [Micromonospora sp. PPF5-17]|uniref:Glycosyl hydrolase family 98 putative carbohydrate-binding module domain-containing protein n=1 Tax=Micromonospora solifontis TaxID=2487138 RepID=A0ABX9WGM9_9ACTN|nr:hypothetical protein [Micromonospora sp. PPF5-17B]NES36829.1 hypothetical protein [Micromonospora solifontis]NES56499.1 hypothetical protein [Micromonospora sp. PPF5-6]RNL99065.1 hypothetical protein EFE23_11780 [Micromonospora solifontis]
MWLLEALVAFVCLAAVVVYLGTEQHATPREERSGVLPGPAGGRPELPAPGASGADSGVVTPGLRPRQRPPSPSPSPSTSTTPAVPPLLTVGQADVPALVDLTAAGPTDWVHWGLLGAGAPVHRRNGSGEIRDEGGRGERVSYSNNPEAYTWRDGTPVESASGTMSGVYTCGKGSGFSLAVAADGRERTVRLYAGLWMARARLDLRLSGGGPASSVRLEDPHTVRTAEFTIRFRAPKGAKLLLSWTVEESMGDCGNVSLQAVALR